MDKHSSNQHVRNVHLSVVLDSDAENLSIYSHCERSDEDRCNHGRENDNLKSSQNQKKRTLLRLVSILKHSSRSSLRRIQKKKEGFWR
jgi:hypothetical protein